MDRYRFLWGKLFQHGINISTLSSTCHQITLSSSYQENTRQKKKTHHPGRANWHLSSRGDNAGFLQRMQEIKCLASGSLLWGIFYYSLPNLYKKWPTCALWPGLMFWGTNLIRGVFFPNHTANYSLTSMAWIFPSAWLKFRQASSWL